VKNSNKPKLLSRRHWLNSGIACHHSEQSLLSSCLLSRTLKYTKQQLYLLFCETWSLTLRDEHRLWMFENRVQGTTSGPKREEVAGGWWRLHNEDVARMGKVEMSTVFWSEKLKRRDHLEAPGVDGKIILERILGEIA